ncbi:FixH family protein [Peribacillus cavernae]|nr:FixH family protein [Peribacillus cavernae]MDQ0219937.1 hypothetical protein [Peribacillus cavernae]
MKRVYLLFFASLLILSACQNKETAEDKEVISNVPDPLTAEISSRGVNSTSKEILLEAIVTQGTKSLDHADEVTFEIRKSGEDNRQLIEADNDGYGKYRIMHTFRDDGKYIVIAHVTAGEQHVMPEKELVIKGGQHSDVN